MDSLFSLLSDVHHFLLFIGQYLHSVWLPFDAEAIRRGPLLQLSKEEEAKRKRNKLNGGW